MLKGVALLHLAMVIVSTNMTVEKIDLIIALFAVIDKSTAQSVVVNPDGTHSVVIDNGSTKTIVNPNGTHSTIIGSGTTRTIVNPNGTHSTLISSGATKIIINPNGAHSTILGSGTTSSFANHYEPFKITKIKKQKSHRKRNRKMGI
nr:hypothetical protein [Cytophagales bacterium]